MYPITLNARALVLAAVLALSTSACTVNGLSLTAPGSLTGAGNGNTTGTPHATGSTKPGAPTQTNGNRPTGQNPTGTQPSPAGQQLQPPTGASTAPVTAASPTISGDVPEIYKRVYGAAAIKVEGDFVVIQVNGLPDHATPYYTGTAWEDRGTDYTGTAKFVKNPSTISEQNFTFKLPMKPAENAAHPATSLGAIGVSLNGVPFFNQYNKDNQPLDDEKVSWDQYLGHPAGGGDYHYHTVPTYLTGKYGEDGLMGFLLDGFPVYGPKEGDKLITNADLDIYHGHVGETPEFPEGIYHYHVTLDAPYINGEGYYGTPGTLIKGSVAGGTTPTGGTMQSPPPGGQTGTQSPPPGGQTGTQSPPPGGQTGGTQSPPPGGQTGTQPTIGQVTFSIAGGYQANEYPVKVELVTPDKTRTAATVTFTSAGQKVTASVPKAGHYMFVTTNGGTRTNKGWLNIASTATEVSMPLPQGSTATAPQMPPR